MKMTIETEAIRAALHCAAKKDARYYLCGVLVRVTKPEFGVAMVCGTDGCVLFAGQSVINWTGEPQTGAFDLIIPYDVCEIIAKFKGSTTVIESLPDGRYLANNTIFTAVDGRFPDVARVIPKTISGETAQFDPALLVRANDALGDYYSTRRVSYRLDHNGYDAAVMHSNDNKAIAVIMPLRFTGGSRECDVDRWTNNKFDRSFL